MILYWLFCIQNHSFLSTCDGACSRQCLNLNEEQPISVINGQTPFSTSYHDKISLILNELI
jgi:hypothetical protein